MSCGILFGPLGHMVEIPAPKSGMGFDLNRDVTASELVSGGRAVYRTPLGYKAFNMSWAGGTTGLGDFMDIFEGAYGNGPFYMLDPRSAGQNLLPTRWASCWQLGHVANGWRKPFVGLGFPYLGMVATPENKYVEFTGAANLATWDRYSPFSIMVPLEKGKSYNLRAWGRATGAARVLCEVWDGAATEPATSFAVPLTGANSTAINTNTYPGKQMFVKLVLDVGRNTTLTLQHMELLATPLPTGFKMGRGVGALQFNGNIQGNLIGNKIDRIGLSVGLTEVETVWATP